MRRYEFAFVFPTAAGGANETSPAEIVKFCVSKVVQIGGTFAATVAIQARVSASDSYVALTTVTAPAIYEISGSYYDLRIVITGWASGAVTASFASFNAQQG